MGIARERLVDQDALPEAYICQICLEVLENPWTVCSDDHLYCKGCSEDFFQNQNLQQHNADTAGTVFKSFDCPVCKNTRSYHRQNYRVSKLAGRLVGQLKVYCTNKELGCKWSGELSNEAGHLTSCSRRMIGCPNGCGEQLRLNMLRQHRLKECDEQALVCPRAKDATKCQFPRYEKGVHDEQCEFWRCRVNENCTTTGSLEMLESTHEPYCREIHDALARAQGTTGIAELETKVKDLEVQLEDFETEVERLNAIVESKEEHIQELQEELDQLKDGIDSDDEEYDHEAFIDEIYSAVAHQAEALKKTDIRVAIRDEEIKRLEKELETLKEKPEVVDEDDLLLSVHPAYGVVKGIKRRRDDLDETESGDSNVVMENGTGAAPNSDTSHANGYSSRFLKLLKLG